MKTELTAVSLLQQKFKATGHDTVTDWMKDTGIDLSLQSCTTVLLRGTEKGLVVMLSLASALQCTPEEMQWIAKECGDKNFWRLITPQVITKEHQELIDAYDALNQHQKKIIASMINQMAPRGGKADKP